LSIKTPRLIRDRCGVYYFRWIVPLAWRPALGKAEIRRSLRTKDASQARQAALLLSARMEAYLADRKNLANPTLADFPHLLRDAPNIREKIRIDIERGIVETDSPEEAQQAREMVADMARARAGRAAGGGHRRSPAGLPLRHHARAGQGRLHRRARRHPQQEHHAQGPGVLGPSSPSPAAL